MTKAMRLTVVMTHPIQYYSPWFRFIASEASEIELTVLYVSEPSPQQQGAQFEAEFTWDVPLRDGYANEVLQPAGSGNDFGSESFWGLDVADVGSAIEQGTPDVVLLSGWHSVSLVRAMFACRRRSIPMLYRGDTHLSDRGWSPLWRIRTRWLLSRFERYLSVGVRTREYLQSFGIPTGSIYASPHAVDNDRFAREARAFREPTNRAQARRELGVARDAFVVAFVGKLDPNKRLEDLIRAMSLVEHPASLVAVGRGPVESQCRELAAELDVQVTWCGFLNQTELGRVYGIADCLVLPSAGETWGLVVNESMAAGLPCVLSDRVGCAPDLIIEGRTGEMFGCGQPVELARALERVRTGRDRASACQEHVSRFSFDAATRGLVAACRDVVT